MCGAYMVHKKLILIGNTSNQAIAEELVKNFDIVAGIVDEKCSQNSINKQREFLQRNNIPETTLELSKKITADAYIILTYNRIIPEDYIKNRLFLNLHGGILPKYRGRSGNLIALLNNEKYLGYTLHKINENMDKEPIYHIFKIKNNKNEFVEDLIDKNMKKTSLEISNIINKILNKKIKPIPQKGNYIYTTPLIPSDGIISCWDKPSDYFLNLYRIYGGKSGSGLYFKYKNENYKITKLSPCPNIESYIGICGGIVYTKGSSFWVKTKDTCISIDEVKKDGILIETGKLFRIGMRL